MENSNQLHADIVIIGGGISGLWTFRRLRDKGYNAILIEKDKLGCGQTLASQGMIHGGQRYTLQGAVTEHSESIASMPGAWMQCLNGDGDVNLANAKLLSCTQHMWSPGGVGSGFTAFMASKKMQGRVDKCDEKTWPEVFSKIPKFNGSVYELDEVVLDIASVLKALIADDADYIYKADITKYHGDKNGISSIDVESDGKSYTLSADEFIVTAGLGNEDVVKVLEIEGNITQRRPLKQLLVKDVEDDLFAHCVATADPRPRATITTHPLKNGGKVWYLGGLVAGYGLDKSNEEAIAHGKKELKEIFPQTDWDRKQWATLEVDRAEPYVGGIHLSDGPEVKKIGNTILAWPTKMTFAPLLSRHVEKVVSSMPKENVKLPLKLAEIDDYPWDKCKWY